MGTTRETEMAVGVEPVTTHQTASMDKGCRAGTEGPARLGYIFEWTTSLRNSNPPYQRRIYAIRVTRRRCVEPAKEEASSFDDTHHLEPPVHVAKRAK